LWHGALALIDIHKHYSGSILTYRRGFVLETDFLLSKQNRRIASSTFRASSTAEGNDLPAQCWYFLAEVHAVLQQVRLRQVISQLIFLSFDSIL
jgi:hypothetical protein